MNSSDRIPLWLGWHGHDLDGIQFVPDPDDIQGVETMSDAEDDAFGTGPHPDIDGTSCAKREPHGVHCWGPSSSVSPQGIHRCQGVRPVASMLLCVTDSAHAAHRWGAHQEYQCPGVFPAVADQFISALCGVEAEDGKPIPTEIRKMAAEVNRRLMQAAAELSQPAPHEKARMVAAQARLDKAKADYEAAERRVWIISQLGDEEPRSDGTALRVRWREYDYILFRAGGFWYTTGRSGPHRARWAAVVDWLAAGATGEIVELIGEENARWTL